MVLRSVLRHLLSLSFLCLAVVLTNGDVTSAQASPSRSSDLELHVVQSGETLATIAAHYHVSAARLAEVNNITEPASVLPGERLLIPRGAASGLAESGISVTVGLGDTLDALAAQYGTTPQDIALANKVMRAELIPAGQSLLIPQTDQTLSPVEVARLSNSMPLWRAALAAKTSMVELALRNHLSSISALGTGTLITLPHGDHPVSSLVSPWVSMRLHSLPLEAGRTGGLTISVDRPGTITGTFLSRELRFQGTGTEYATVFGVERWAKPGLYPMSITFTDASGNASTVERNVIVIRGNYASEIVKLSEEATAARNDPQVVADELTYLTQKMSGFTPQQYWSGMFRLPAAGILTSAFGSVRSINNSGYDSYHTGNDLAATTGLPIYAPADGVVVDTGLLEIRGYSTIIDHGSGVYTGYWHQAGILVRPGDRVTAGQQIGVVGNTGSSTASHVHWEMWVGGVPVDSLQWAREVFP